MLTLEFSGAVSLPQTGPVAFDAGSWPTAARHRGAATVSLWQREVVMRLALGKQRLMTRALAALTLVVLVLLARSVLRERTSDELYQIPAGELPLVVAAATHGDVSAAERLQDHFLFWAEDRATAQLWMRRAADLGSEESRALLVDELARSDREPDRVEAKELAARWRKGQ